MKYSYRLIILCALLVFAGQTARASIPPHPDLKARIAAGKLARPYYLEHQRELLARGVNAPWAAPSLGLQKGLAPGAPLRSLGPAQAPVGPFNALLILVDFSDNVQQVQATKFDTLVFNTSPGTVSDYFSEVSYGNLTIVTVDLPSQIGWTRVDSTYAYYVDGQNGFGDYPKNAQKLVEDVVTAVNGVVDFSLYDNDADNEVDALFIAHAGPGAEFTGNDNDIWSHAWVTYNPPILDGVSIWRYSMEPEFWASPGDMTIGVYAHEMGHSVFGLPDLYDRDGSSSGLGRWSLMAGGSWNGNLGDTPAYPDAWSHIEMGYLNTVDLLSNVPGQVISHVEATSMAYRVWPGGNFGDEYFILENRQLVGYDAALPGGGLHIYHIDETVGTQNDNQWYPTFTDSGHYLVALEQADGDWDLEHDIGVGNSGDDGDPFPGVTNNTAFNDATIPDSRYYTLGSTDIAIQNISASANDMTVDVFIDIPLAVTPDSLSAELVIGDSVTQAISIRNAGVDTLTFDLLIAARSLAAAVPPGPFASLRVSAPAFDAFPGGKALRLAESASLSQTASSNAATAPSISSSTAAVSDHGTVLVLSTVSISASVLLALTNLGVTYDHIATTVFTGIDFSPYQTVIVALDGGLVETASVQALADAAGAGRKLIIVGGTNYGPYYIGMESYLLSHTNQQGWVISAPPHLTVTDTGHPLVAGVPASYNFVNSSAANYMLRVSDPVAAVAAVNGDGHPILLDKPIGTGHLVAFLNSALDSYWLNAADFAVLETVLDNALTGGVSWLSANPTSATLAPGDSVAIDITFNATGLLGGDYEAYIVLADRDSTSPDVRVPAHLRAIGIPDIALAPDTLEFGSVFVGHPSTQILTVTSRGTDSLRVSAIAADHGAFSVDPSVFVLGPGDSLNVSVTFTAATAGVISATITVTSNAPAAMVGLNATATQPAEIVLSPDSLSADLFPDDTTTQVLTVHNLGAGELVWSVAANDGQRPPAAPAFPAEYYQYIPKGSVDSRVGPPVERGQGGPDVFGYTWIDSDGPGGPVFNWLDISGTGLNSGITLDDDTAWVNLGFSFSFYGRDYDQVLIGENGTLSFINYGFSDFSNDPIPSTNSPNALIAVFWDDHYTPDGGAIYYETRGSEPSRTFIVQWHQVPHISDINSVFTYQVILSEAAGSIVFQYETMTGSYGDGSYATVGIEDSLGVDGLQVSFNTGYVHNGLAIRLSTTPPWLTVAPGSGTVAPGGSQDVVVTFNSTGLVPGILQGHLTFDSNDPGNASTSLPVSLRIPLIGPPLITGIADVPADQGGWVMASWLASPDDSHQSPHPVLFYSVWLYGPGAATLPAVPVLAAAESSLTAGRSPLAGPWLSRDTDGVAGSAGAAPSSPGAARDDYPVFSGAQLGAPGWIGVGSIGATLDSAYTFLVPTWQDSNAAGTHWSRIRVSAHTSVVVAGFAFSAPDSGYSVDNIAPAVPAGLVAVPTELGVSLSWTYDTAAEADFQYFAVYRGTETGFTPVHPDSSIATTTDPAYADEQVDPGVTYFYRVAAVDYNGNVSDLSAEVAGFVLALTDGLGIPDAYALRQNYPNPFNPSTTIRFELPEATPLTLAIFDILGREVVRLSAGTLEAGYHQVVWNGRTAAGREVTTGLYIVRLVSPAFTDQFKMVLMK
ncbi:MAG: M6 family metalloprotease domain-containing protein [Candidatus Marinimicrobia bacterium]|nr:M6 family metalloprotease domain-containing protein [Candidatus Neomarinimicrobiota bacterium]